jgi:hypothetical protein
MRTNVLLAGLLFVSTGVYAQSNGDQAQHTKMITPDEEAEYFSRFWSAFTTQSLRYRFQQTTWGECSEFISGNYNGFRCSDSRVISVILKKYLNDNLYTCINKGLAVQGGGTVEELHIIHDGITGDANHSPRSLHAENRAIDVHSFNMKLFDGRTLDLIYAATANRPFYTAFRKCWGDAVSRGNGCPLYSGQTLLTASIGWENANHRQHMHLSVPYCVNGRYSSAFYQK